MEVWAVNPHAESVEGIPCVSSLSELTQSIHGCAIVTPPEVTEAVVDEAIELGIKHLWMQPGAESDDAVERAQFAGIQVVSGGPCLLVVLGYRGN